MINVCFCEHVAGTLKIHLGTKRRKLDVVCFNLHLNYGDLSQSVFSRKRLKEANAVFNEEWLYQPVFTTKYIFNIKKKLHLINKLLKKGECLRIWFDDSANEYCSFLYLISIFSQYREQIRFVDTGRMGFDESILTPWLEMTPENVGKFIDKEQQLTKDLAPEKINEWQEICSDHSPLRILDDGEIKGVTLDYYDSIIEDTIPSEEYCSDLLYRDLLHRVGNIVPYELMLHRLSFLVKRNNYQITHIAQDSRRNSKPYIRRIRFIKHK